MKSCSVQLVESCLQFWGQLLASLPQLGGLPFGLAYGKA